MQKNRDLREYLEALGYDPEIGVMGGAKAIPVTKSIPEVGVGVEVRTMQPTTSRSASTNNEARLVFVNESHEEDRGPAELLTKMIDAMGWGSQRSVVVLSLAKSPHLPTEIEVRRPEVIVALGAQAAQALQDAGIDDARIVRTHSLAALLQNTSLKKEAWAVLQNVMQTLGLPNPR